MHTCSSRIASLGLGDSRDCTTHSALTPVAAAASPHEICQVDQLRGVSALHVANATLKSEAPLCGLLSSAAAGQAVRLCQPGLEPLHRPLHADRVALNNTPRLRHQHGLLLAHLRLSVRPTRQRARHRLVQAGAARRHRTATQCQPKPRYRWITHNSRPCSCQVPATSHSNTQEPHSTIS
jgi:hypothetical protein